VLRAAPKKLSCISKKNTVTTTRDIAAGLAMTVFREKEKPLPGFLVIEGWEAPWENSQ
jgi:hypothetical protein